MKETSQNRLVLILFIISSVVVMGLCIFTSINLNLISKYAYLDTEERLLALSQYAAKYVSAQELNELQEPADMEKPIYAEIKQRLADFADVKNLIYVYYMRNNDNNMAQYIIDNILTDDSDNLSSDPFEWEEKAWLSLNGTAIAEMEEYLEGYEHLISAFAPVFDDSGKVIAVAGVDIDDRRIVTIRNTTHLLIPLLIGGVLLSVACCFTIMLLHKRTDKLWLRNRDLLAMVNQAAVRLLTIESEWFEVALRESMGKMAINLNLDCACIWRLRERDSIPVYKLLYCWFAPDADITKTFENEFATNTIPRTTYWDDKMFTKQGYMSEISDNFDNPIHSMLLAQGIKAIMAFPVFLQGRYWGFVAFENKHSEELCSKEEASILQSGSLLLANAVERNDNIRQLNDRLEQQELMSSISKSFITKESLSDLIRTALERMGVFMDMERVLIAVFEKDSEISHPEYFWIKEQKYLPQSDQKGFSSILKEFFPHHLNEGDNNLVIYCDNTLTYKEGKYILLYEKTGLKSFICTPIYVESELWGILSIEKHEEFRTWNENDSQLVGTVSSAISNAVSRDIMEKERTKALEQAITASKAKSSFLSNMSHEMRTPMNAIIGMTAIGKSASSIERKDYSFNKIEDASNHLLGVINDILDMSKIEAGKFDLLFEEFSFERMLQRAVNVVNYKILEKRQKFKIYVDRNIPEYLIGDSQRLTQVITNLVGNAVKFTPEEGKIRIGTYFLGENNNICTIKITVTDTGIGISQEQQANLFKSFQQAENSTSRKFGGTGLGLVISKNIVEMMDGEIWIESEIKKGATFSFTVKVHRSNSSEQKPIGYGLNWNNINIMVVDDDTDNKAFFKKITEEFGAHCDTVSTGEEALKTVKENKFYDIYFIGRELPDMDSLELIKTLKEIKTIHKKSTIAMFTDQAANLNENEVKKIGVDKFTNKPLFPSNIIDVTNDILGLNNKYTDEITNDNNIVFKDCHILLVEDVEINREIVVSMLEPTLLKIDCAENGMQALKMFEAAPEKYNLILMDIQMPEMDGYEATRHIRAFNSPRAKEIPIIAMTANVFREDIERCFKAGMNDHIGKPLAFDEVFSKLKVYLAY